MSMPDDQLDRLDLGAGKPRRSHESWWRALALIAMGAILGWGAHAGTDLRIGEARQTSGAALVMGSFQQNLLDPYGPEMLMSVTNTGRAPVTITKVAPAGWRARIQPVQVPAGAVVDIPVDVSLDCATARWPGETAEVRVGTGSSARTLLLPTGGTAALYELWSRRCWVQSLRVPTRREVTATWVVSDGGPGFTGKMFIEFLPTGRYRMDPGAHLDDSPGAAGRWSLHDARLRLVSTRGGDCGPQHRATWEVGMRGDLLHIRQLTTYDGFCSVDRGDVWLAERLS